MGFRITMGMKMNTYRYNLMLSTNNVANAQQKVSTHRKFNSYAEDPASSPPLALTAVFIAIPTLLICGVLFALFQRIREIGKGEIDDAKKY